MIVYDINTDPQNRTYTVAELNRNARTLLEGSFGGIWLEAEVVESKRAVSGHVYFSLADPGGGARISAVMWRGQATRYAARLAVGKVVRCFGRVTLYEARGSYQMVADRLEEAGAGANAQLLAELKEKLLKEGLFDAERKRPLPRYPRCVGVVTSGDGAAFRDILKVASRRFPVRIVLAHAQVQGDGAPESIVNGLDRIAAVSEVEVVILGRGGGGTEDLDAFNAEAVVRKVASHPTPVVSAVGHEIDTTLVDLVADRRAATPSEAAELVVPDGVALAERLAQREDDMGDAMRRLLSMARAEIAIREGRLMKTDPRTRLRRGVERLTRSREALARWPILAVTRARAELESRSAPLFHWPRSALDRHTTRLTTASNALERWPGPALAQFNSQLIRLTSSLDALSPLASLSRGYSVVRRSPDDVIVRSSDQAPAGTEVEITLSRGRLACTVNESLPPESPAAESSGSTLGMPSIRRD